MTHTDAFSQQVEKDLIHLLKTDPMFQPTRITSFIAAGEEGTQEMERYLARHPERDGRADRDLPPADDKE